MLDNEERIGFIRLIFSGMVLIASLFALLFFGVNPHLCGAGFIVGSMIGALGHFRLKEFYPIKDKENREIVLLLALFDLMLIAGAIFGVLLMFDWI